MRYLVLIHVNENAGDEPPASLMDAMFAHVADESHAKVITDAGLAPTSVATRITSQGGQVLLTDGPFAEAKEVVGGFMLIDAPTSEDAVEWTRGFVDLHAEHWPDLEVVTELRQIVGSLTED
ncbi:YciI family protein [Aeromicrobium sp. 9AM]|uniref:YciI family protein n=1 Tax=Aeromicrobium sp. 9AM TaxID=2653126 RepID=UPI0012F29A40|nr:YciI family protein [Aeromicrobium sp. 9AM]VXC40577.1 conserved hypothetical protein [Aeromicrobium sp. 9AM]